MCCLLPFSRDGGPVASQCFSLPGAWPVTTTGPSLSPFWLSSKCQLNLTTPGPTVNPSSKTCWGLKSRRIFGPILIQPGVSEHVLNCSAHVLSWLGSDMSEILLSLFLPVVVPILLPPDKPLGHRGTRLGLPFRFLKVNHTIYHKQFHKSLSSKAISYFHKEISYFYMTNSLKMDSFSPQFPRYILAAVLICHRVSLLT